MRKTLLLTGATDGIGLETARELVSRGHRVLLHGRKPSKLATVEAELASLPGEGSCMSYAADLSNLREVEKLAAAVVGRHSHLDALINNAGVFKTSRPRTPEGLDVRFVVNTHSF